MLRASLAVALALVFGGAHGATVEDPCECTFTPGLAEYQPNCITHVDFEFDFIGHGHCHDPAKNCMGAGQCQWRNVEIEIRATGPCVISISRTCSGNPSVILGTWSVPPGTSAVKVRYDAGPFSTLCGGECVYGIRENQSLVAEVVFGCTDCPEVDE